MSLPQRATGVCGTDVLRVNRTRVGLVHQRHCGRERICRPANRAHKSNNRDRLSTALYLDQRMWSACGESHRFSTVIVKCARFISAARVGQSRVVPARNACLTRLTYSCVSGYGGMPR